MFESQNVIHHDKYREIYFDLIKLYIFTVTKVGSVIRNTLCVKYDILLVKSRLLCDILNQFMKVDVQLSYT